MLSVVLLLINLTFWGGMFRGNLLIVSSISFGIALVGYICAKLGKRAIRRSRHLAGDSAALLGVYANGLLTLAMLGIMLMFLGLFFLRG